MGCLLQWKAYAEVVAAELLCEEMTSLAQQPGQPKALGTAGAYLEEKTSSWY